MVDFSLTVIGCSNHGLRAGPLLRASGIGCLKTFLSEEPSMDSRLVVL